MREPMRVYMSGGTTGTSRPTFYTQWDREVGTLLMARGLYMQGIRPGDVVLNSWSYGTHNGAWSFDEGLYRWLNCVILTTSTGKVTATEKQVDLAVEYKANAILTTGDYLLRLAEVARERGYNVGTDLKITALTNLGDRDALEAAFGLPYYRSYGFHEVQWVAQECAARDGLHVYEDAFVVQIVDPETGEEVPDGQTGAMVITELYKTGSPQFRYNNMDLSFRYPREQCACGSWLRRIGPFAGRGDNMVKLRGTNVWPEALGELAMAVDGVTSDYFVRGGPRGQPRRDAAVGGRRGRSERLPGACRRGGRDGSPTSSVSPSRCGSCGPASSTRSPRSRPRRNPSVSRTNAGERGALAASSTTCRTASCPTARRSGTARSSAPGCRSRCARATRTRSPSRPRWSRGWTSSASRRCCCRRVTSARTARSIPLTTSTSRPTGTRWRSWRPSSRAASPPSRCPSPGSA